MIFAYLLPGFASSIALIIYTELMLITLNAFDITLTLPGIAGIILSIGMGVDANIITAERIKEVIAEGKSVRAAIESGFQMAFSSVSLSACSTMFTRSLSTRIVSVRTFVCSYVKFRKEYL